MVSARLRHSEREKHVRREGYSTQIQEDLMNESANIETPEFEPTRSGVPSGAPASEPGDTIRYAIQEKK
jgi:hypothetical protein